MPRPSREQFERLVREHHAAVHRAARRLCGDDAAAADVAQDVFVRILLGKEHLEVARDERATLCWLATRLAANARRSARRRDLHEEHAMRDNDPNRRLSAQDPAAASAAADLHREVRHHVAALPPELRVPLLLRWQDELTLAAIGTALRLPTSTVHDRVQAALQRLRTALLGRGHAIAPAALPALLVDVEAAPAPLGLQDRLLALGTRAMPVAAGIGRRLAIAFVAASTAAGLLWAVQPAGGGSPAASPPLVASASTANAQEPGRQSPPTPVVPPPRTEVGTSGPLEQAAPTPRVVATFTGTVRDAQAWPVAGATVEVVAGGGYKAFAVGTPVTTDARGGFAIDVVSSWLQPRAVRLRIVEKAQELLQTGDLAVPRPAGAAPLELVLPAKAGTATSKYELTVAVRDEAGQPLAGVEVRLFAAVEPAPDPDWGKTEANGTSGPDGRAVLAGRGLGAKWLFVDGRKVQRPVSLARVSCDEAGPQQREVTLPAGRELDVLVTTVSGRDLSYGQPWLVDEATGVQLSGDQLPDGTTRFRGLGDGTVTVRANGDGTTSHVVRRGVRPMGERLVLRLKEHDDEQDIGDHAAELHGELVDAATGEVVPFGPFAVDVKPVRASGSSLVFDGVEPPAPAQSASAGGRWSRFHETGLDAGTWIVTASIPGYALAGEVVELRANEVRTGIRIALVKQAVVRGKVVDAAGRPLVGVTLFAVGVGPLADANIEAWRAHRDAARDPGLADPSWQPVSGWTRKDGTFEVARIPPGVPLRLVVRHHQHGFVVLPLPPLGVGEVVANLDVRLDG